MAENRIIAYSDIAAYWYIPSTVNKDTTKISIAILEAQQADLKRVLGEALYYDFIEDYDPVGLDFVTASYQTLFDGGDYTYQGNTIYFSGVKQLLCAYSFIHLAKNNKIHIVRGGVVVKTVEESETAEDFQLRAIIRKAFDQASRIEGELTRFLYENRATYPLYNYKSYEGQRKTGFNFYVVK